MCRVALISLFVPSCLLAAEPGYFRQPTIHGETIVFVAESDLWKVPATGGPATRLTTHPGEEGMPAISPDGKTIAFTAQYEGPTEVYTMPLAGGRPTRCTWDSAKISHVGWTRTGKLLISTDIDSTLPSQQLAILDCESKRRQRVPLAQAADGAYAADGTLYFTRLPFQGSQCKNYHGGTVQQVWKFKAGEGEASPLTNDYAGTSKNPIALGNRIYFISERSGTMNIWSMDAAGKDLKQHTKHDSFDVIAAAGDQSRIVYQHKAQLRILDPGSDKDTLVEIALNSDFDHTRDKIIPKPIEWLSSAHLSPNGDRIALTARGKVYVAPSAAGKGRFVEITRKPGVRYRSARFMPDGKSLLVMSDESGEVEFWKYPALGPGSGERLTKDGGVLRWEGVPSPNGKFVAHHDKDQRLWVFDVEKKSDRKITESKYSDFEGLAWAPDSKWLAYVEEGENLMRRISLLNVEKGQSTFVTTDRFDSFSPAWSADGKFLYFLSNRNLSTVVASPWGIYQPEPFFDKKTKIYGLPIAEGLRSPFMLKEESTEPEPTKKDLDPAGIEKRIIELPIPPGNYEDLTANDKALFLLSRPTEGQSSLLAVGFAEKPTVHTVASNVRGYELSKEGNKLLIRVMDSLNTTDATATTGIGSTVDLAPWMLTVKPREEWRQMFLEAWRLERDYFYDRGMHGVNWDDVRKKYEPLVERVASRADLNDLLEQMVGELSALHIFVRGGDSRRGPDSVPTASLGARLERDEQAGGYRIEHIYQHDPDEPHRAGPLSKPGVNAKVGDIILELNGVPTLEVADVGEMLRKQAGQPVLLKTRRPGEKEIGWLRRYDPSNKGRVRELTVRPLSTFVASDLRYHEWEYTRRKTVDEASKNSIGYVHLRQMGSNDINAFAKDFYPAFTTTRHDHRRAP